jgi:hypothetical protein
MVLTARKEMSERFHSLMKEPQTTACGVIKWVRNESMRSIENISYQTCALSSKYR